MHRGATLHATSAHSSVSGWPSSAWVASAHLYLLTVSAPASPAILQRGRQQQGARDDSTRTHFDPMVWIHQLLGLEGCPVGHSDYLSDYIAVLITSLHRITLWEQILAYHIKPVEYHY